MLKVHNFVNALVTALERKGKKAEERKKKKSHINQRI